MSKGQTLQDPFLNSLRKDRIPVSIFLVNGIKLQGQIESFDQYVVLLKNTVSQMVYKHAISTVVPARNPRSSATPGGIAQQPAGYPSGFGANPAAAPGFDRGAPGFEPGGFGSKRSSGFNRGGFSERGFTPERGGFVQERGFGVERSFDSDRPFGASRGPQNFGERGFEKRGFATPTPDDENDLGKNYGEED